MMKQGVNFNQFFNNIDCPLIIFFEDDFSLLQSDEFSKSELIYEISRMELGSREDFLSELHDYHTEFVNSLRHYCDHLDRTFHLITNWNEDVIRGEMDSFLENIRQKDEAQYKELNNLYNNIELPDLTESKVILLKYGICINVPPLYQELFNEHIFLENKWKAVRIFTNFNADSSKSFNSELNKFFKTGQDDISICCIIDNELSREKRAKDIINEIRNFNEKKRHFIIGAVVTSHEKTEGIDEKVFLEYVKKSMANTTLMQSLLKSTYNYAISKLKDEMIFGLNKTFSRATVNRNIAFYLSQMAVLEGVANYQIINSWINTMSNYELAKSKAIPNIVKVTNLINQVPIENYELTDEMEMLNTFEAFDFNVNSFHQPPAAGDVFIDNNNKVYILVGQDCDIMMSETRKRRTALLELVPAQIVSQSEMFKVKNNLNHMMINNFRISLSDSSSCLKIDYTKREYLDNELLNLCTFNNNGDCKISIKNNLPSETSKLIMPYLNKYYIDLQDYFSSIKTLKSNEGVALNIFLDNSYNPRLIPIHKYTESTEGEISYPFRRICRLKDTYVLYLYKLYLEYRGRQPYNSINLARCQTLDIPIINSKISGEISIQIILSGDRGINSKPAKLPWEISRNEIIRLLNKLGEDSLPKKKDDYIILESGVTEIELENSRLLKLTKNNKLSVQLELV